MGQGIKSTTFIAIPPLEAPDAICPSLSTHITPTVSIVQSFSASVNIDDWHVVPSSGLCDWTSTQSKPKMFRGVGERRKIK